MTSIMEIGEGGIDPQTEVRKLQDLVKKLETQNEVLRSKQKLSTSDNDSNIIETGNEVLKPAVNNSVFYNNRKHSEKRDIAKKTESLESVELIDVNSPSHEDDDNWLYSSPRPLTPQQHRMSPYKWVRQDLDSPAPDITSARKSLKYKLDEVARMSRSSSTPVFHNYSTPPKANSPAMSLSADNTPSPRIMKPSAMKPHAKSSLAYSPGLQGSRLNTGTFTRPKKSRDKPSPAETPEDDVDGEEPAIHHQNVTDIENMAKQQEESLRQSMAHTSPRRGFRSRPLPNTSASQYNDSNSLSSADSNRSSPARLEEGEGRRDSTNSAGSDHSSPPDSPYASNQHLHVNNAGASNFRGSAPNVSRLIPRVQHHNSDSSLTDHSNGENGVHNDDSPKYASRLPLSPLGRPASPSVSGLKQPQRAMRGPSPQRSGLPTPKRSIPRPGSTTPRSSIPTTPKRRSGPSNQ
ncbi:SLAI2-like protein [Mya arenaria]|uniref:SLAI2-like protein n=1 Tax=Mya arenaria TaxID=6604 RepID=A0ABY7DLF7_MYAAR|nr:SLAI2-like protein [Mya arenaria]